MSSYRMKYMVGNEEHSLIIPEDISSIPLGSILPYFGNDALNPPQGFLFCDGTAVSRTLYPDLFSLIGISFGAGDGETTFNLPDLTKAALMNGTYDKTEYTTAGSYTFTAPKSGYYKFTVKGGGGGGAGGYLGSASRQGGSGGGEGGLTFACENLSVGATVSIVVGAGGNGGAVSGNGSAGGSSSVTIVSRTYTAGGGGGGITGQGSGGFGGSGTIIGAPGDRQGSGILKSDSSISAMSGSGGGNGGGTTGDGVSGSGGAGGTVNAANTATTGYRGGDGYCWVEFVGQSQNYLIKTYNSTTQNSALIDVTQYATALNNKADKADGVPLGVVLPFTGNGNIPAGYLLCDGSAVSRTMYEDLFGVIGTLYGSGDGSTTFNLPDLSDKFIEGSTVAGTEKAVGLPNITTGEFFAVGTYPAEYNGVSEKFGAITRKLVSNQYARGSATGSSVAISFDASDSNIIYGNSTTVQPPALTLRYIIKAFNGIASGSQLINITQYASELNQRYDVRTDMTIVYPNGGTAANPANIVSNSSYVVTNPFPGYAVRCQVEVFYNNEWGISRFNGYYTNNDNCSAGTFAYQHNDGNIVLATGKNGVLGHSNYALTNQPTTFVTGSTGKSSIPARIKVWKIGKL